MFCRLKSTTTRKIRKHTSNLYTATKLQFSTHRIWESFMLNYGKAHFISLTSLPLLGLAKVVYIVCNILHDDTVLLECTTSTEVFLKLCAWFYPLILWCASFVLHQPNVESHVSNREACAPNVLMSWSNFSIPSKI